MVKVQDKDKAVVVDKAVAVVKAAVVVKASVVVWDRAVVADEAWVVGVDVVWGAVAAPLVLAASASVSIAVRPFHISKVYLALNKTAQSAARR